MTPLSDDEREALSLLSNLGTLQHRMGVRKATMESLQERGYVELIVFRTGHKWVASLTESGKPVAEEYRRFVKPVTDADISKATSAVAMELFKADPENGLVTVYEHMSYGSLSAFEDSVKRWIKDRSELRASVIESADYRELYADFCGYEEREPVWEDQGQDDGQAEEIPGVVLPENPQESARLAEAIRDHLSRPVPRMEDIPGLTRGSSPGRQ